MQSQLRNKMRKEIIKIFSVSFLFAIVTFYIFPINLILLFISYFLLVSFFSSLIAVQKRRKLISKIMSISSLFDVDKIKLNGNFHSGRGFTNEYFQKLEVNSYDEGLIVCFLYGEDKRPFLIPWEAFTSCEYPEKKLAKLWLKSLGINLVIPINKAIKKAIDINFKGSTL